MTGSGVDGLEPDGPGVDGRKAKGQRRRRAIVDAALRVVSRDGVAGISHRSVAREAGVPPASIAYYFSGIDELLVATLLESVDTLVVELESLRAGVRGSAELPAAVARSLVRMVGEHRERTMAEYELYLLAARRPALRPAARRWIEVAAGYIAGRGDPAAVRALLAAVDGLLVQGLIADEPPSPEELEPVLRLLLEPLIR